MLRKMGAKEIADAADGVEARVHLEQSTTPDVILLDLIMPEMGGVELLRHLAEHSYPGAIILVSGTDKDTITAAEGLANYRNLNVLGHIVKPMTPTSLSDILTRLE
jgi:CheY-like chemotaxis protein